MLKTLPLILVLLSLTSCGGRVVTRTEAKPEPPPAPKPPTTVPAWLGNPSRNFYGTGPWSNDPLQVVWEFETKGISGRLHEDPWGGSSWPGQPSVDEHHVYFGSADGNLYCLDARDGSLVWKYQTGFEVDCSAAVINDRVYFGGEDHFFYSLNLSDGSLVYKTERLGSMEGSFSVVDDRVYVGTEQGDLFCLNLADGKTIWQARIGADSDSTPAVSYTHLTLPTNREV